MVSSVVMAALDAGSTSLGLSIRQRYIYYHLWDCWVGAMLTTSTLGTSMHHVNALCLSQSKIYHAVCCSSWNCLHVLLQTPACFHACARLADPIQLLVQGGVLSNRHALNYFPPNLKWVYKHPDLECVAGHMGYSQMYGHHFGKNNWQLMWYNWS